MKLNAPCRDAAGKQGLANGRRQFDYKRGRFDTGAEWRRKMSSRFYEIRKKSLANQLRQSTATNRASAHGNCDYPVSSFGIGPALKRIES
jgi:hypothetical protein